MVMYNKYLFVHAGYQLQKKKDFIYGNVQQIFVCSCWLPAERKKKIVAILVVNFLSHVIFVFLLFLGMTMYANDVETKEKLSAIKIKYDTIKHGKNIHEK